MYDLITLTSADETRKNSLILRLEMKGFLHGEILRLWNNTGSIVIYTYLERLNARNDHYEEIYLNSSLFLIEVKYFFINCKITLWHSI